MWKGENEGKTVPGGVGDITIRELCRVLWGQMSTQLNSPYVTERGWPCIIHQGVGKGANLKIDYYLAAFEMSFRQARQQHGGIYIGAVEAFNKSKKGIKVLKAFF